VIFLQKDHNAVFELDAPGLLRLELVQLGDGNLLPGFFLLGGEGDGGEQGDARQDRAMMDLERCCIPSGAKARVCYCDSMYGLKPCTKTFRLARELAHCAPPSFAGSALAASDFVRRGGGFNPGFGAVG
jgi:hypothetical protein